MNRYKDDVVWFGAYSNSKTKAYPRYEKKKTKIGVCTYVT